MLILTISVNAPLSQVEGVKEQIAMELERWGDTRVLKIEEPYETYEQITL